MNELKDAFYSSKNNERPDCDNISCCVNLKTIWQSCELLKHLFNLSIEKDVFPHCINIGRLTPIYKGEDSSDISNYRSISVVPCFSKILEHIIYNLLYKSLIENNIYILNNLVSKTFIQLAML